MCNGFMPGWKLESHESSGNPLREGEGTVKAYLEEQRGGRRERRGDRTSRLGSDELSSWRRRKGDDDGKGRRSENVIMWFSGTWP